MYKNKYEGLINKVVKL